MTADSQRSSKGLAALQLLEVGALGALLDGRLTVVDRFDRDGRTHLVAVHSESLALRARSLSSHERRAARFAREGHANKAIALHLGLSESRVSTLMRAVAEKLGARSRVDLVRVLASLPDRVGAEREESP
jgi:DNA-binding NarL/FixJ family response regulator